MSVLSALVAGVLAAAHYAGGVGSTVGSTVVHRPLVVLVTVAAVVLLNVVARSPEQTGRVLYLATHAPSLLIRRRASR